ncbi:MAG: hypothetical protein ABUS54_12780 [Actinomycetota bacterium]
MGRKRWAALVVLVLAAALAGVAVADRTRGDDKTFEYSIGLWGDLPYSAAEQTALEQNLIPDMNAAQLAFTVHDGDLKQGSNSPCNDALYTTALGWFDALSAPAMFTTGDNDWTDCDRASNGGFDSRERLDHERQVFFSTPFSLGRRKLLQEVDRAPECLNAAGQHVACVEMRRWNVGGVVYATLNVQGSCNNLCDTNRQGVGDSGDPDEWAARNQAVIDWMNQTFDQAQRTDAAAVMLISQGDPGWDLSDATRAPLRDPQTLAETDAHAAQDGYAAFLRALRARVIAFGKQVDYVNGDSHYFRIDKPLLDSTGKRVENFTRVETFGDNQQMGTEDVQWLRVDVDPESRDVFAYEPEIIPANAQPNTP